MSAVTPSTPAWLRLGRRLYAPCSRWIDRMTLRLLGEDTAADQDFDANAKLLVLRAPY